MQIPILARIPKYLVPGMDSEFQISWYMRCCSHINSYNQKSVFTGQAPVTSHSGVEEYPRAKLNQPKVVRIVPGTRIPGISYELKLCTAVVIYPPKNIKKKSEVDVRTCQTHAGTHVSRLAAETDFYTGCHPRNQTKNAQIRQDENKLYNADIRKKEKKSERNIKTK